jgi:Lon protease-like protein
MPRARMCIRPLITPCLGIYERPSLLLSRKTSQFTDKLLCNIIMQLSLILCFLSVSLLNIYGFLHFRGQMFSERSLRWPNVKSSLSSTADGQPVEVQSAIFNEQVKYIDLNAADSTSSSPNSRTLPLFLLGAAFYPQGSTYLHVFEMRYRTMMFDISNSDKLFGYIHTNSRTGQIAAVGTLCKITETELLEDGRQYIALDGVGRFKLKKIVKTLPYVVGEVELDMCDDIPADIPYVVNLEASVYDALKYYIRLIKSYTPNRELTISQAAKNTRPTLKNALDHIRRTDFSFALANMIQMTQDKETQILLQTSDIIKRLEAEKLILTQASELISEKLIQMGVLTADQRDAIKTRTYTSSDDSDILPQDTNDEKNANETDEWDISNIM